MQPVTAFACFFLLTASCTTTRVQKGITDREIAAINENGGEAELRLSDGFGPKDSFANSVGRPVEATRVTFTPATVTWTDTAGTAHSTQRELVRGVEYLSPGFPRLRGFLEGIGIGLLPGLTLGAAWALACNFPGGSPNGVPGEPAANCGLDPAAFGLMLGMVGVVVGGIAGALHGHHDVVRLDAR